MDRDCETNAMSVTLFKPLKRSPTQDGQLPLFGGSQIAVATGSKPVLPPTCEADLVALALGLGARTVDGWSPEEERLASGIEPVPARFLSDVIGRMRLGDDPLGEAFCRLRSAGERRRRGATYTPPVIVRAMIAWAAREAVPSRVVDPGTGSGRFLWEAAATFPSAELVGVEVDPTGAILARANAATRGLASRTRILLSDYRQVELSEVSGRTLYIGNPPYVRHHLLAPSAKRWLVDQAHQLGIAASQLAGLHAYFFLATATRARDGDFGTFITAAEWLDVNYGSLIRELFVGRLGGSSICVIEPTARPFADAATTAAIATFTIGSRRRSIGVKRVRAIDQLDELGEGRVLRRERLETERRWSHLTRIEKRPPDGYVELGELCRVHRGAVTGNNRVWIEDPHGSDLPASVLLPTVTRAKELFNAGTTLSSASALRRVIDLPVDLDVFAAADRKLIDRFLAKAKTLGGNSGYVATNRKAWWSVGLRQPPPILATYMARRPPAFVRNLAGARYINVAHGLYPRDPLPESILMALAGYLSRTTTQTQGRTYAGGLTKFEPREMERLFVPEPKLLAGVEVC